MFQFNTHTQREKNKGGKVNQGYMSPERQQFVRTASPEGKRRRGGSPEVKISGQPRRLPVSQAGIIHCNDSVPIVFSDCQHLDTLAHVHRDSWPNNANLYQNEMDQEGQRFGQLRNVTPVD